MLVEVATGLAVAVPVGPELPPLPLTALLEAVELKVAGPVLPALPFDVAAESVELPEVALPVMALPRALDVGSVADPPGAVIRSEIRLGGESPDARKRSAPIRPMSREPLKALARAEPTKLGTSKAPAGTPPP